MSAGRKVRVAILDDHPPIIDGYLSRFNQAPDIEVVGSALYGDELEPMLAQSDPDVLILDVQVPTSQDNPNFYPILHEIPKLLQVYPDLDVLVITMSDRRQLVQAVMEAGASGYILKEDQKSYLELASIVRLVSQGGIYLSQKVRKHLLNHGTDEPLLTPRQREALSLCSAYPDATTGELSLKMGIAQSTLRNLLSTSYLRLDVHSRTAAVVKAVQLGLIVAPDPLA